MNHIFYSLPLLWLIGYGCGQFESIQRSVVQSSQQNIDLSKSQFPIPKECSSYQIESSMPTARRLTRFEYQSVIEDTFGVDVSDKMGALPEDVRSSGFLNQEEALSVSRDHIRAYKELANEIIDLIPNFESFLVSGWGFCDDLSASCYQSFLSQAIISLFRRPASTEELSLFDNLRTSLQTENGNFEELAKNTLVTLLQLPQFLYRLEKTGSTGILKTSAYEMASRLSFLVWQSSPDDELLSLAENGALLERNIISQQIKRMVQSPKAKRAFRNYIVNWLHLDLVGQIDIQPNKYPELSAQVLRDMREQTLLHMTHLVFEEKRSLLEAFTDRSTFLNENLGKLYGMSLAGNEFQKVDIAHLNDRVGILTHPSLLMASLKTDNPSIVQRGVFINEHISCQEILEPPPGTMDSVIIPTPGQSQRDQLEAHRSNPTCAGCHSVLDGPGMAFEPFNTIGIYRGEDEQGHSLSSSGDWMLSGTKLDFQDTIQFAEKLAQDPATQYCVAEKLFQFSLGKTLGHEHECEVWSVMDRFAQSDFRYEELLLLIATTETYSWSADEEK